MTRIEARRRRKRIRKLQRAGAFLLLALVEILTAASLAALVAAIVLPILYAERGYYAIGSEWLLISLVFSGTFYMIHNKICDKIFKEG